MMFFVPLTLLTLAAAPAVLDLRRLPELSVYGLLASVLATIQDRAVLVYPLWEYRDIGPIGDHAAIALFISLSAAPIFAMRFIQGLSPGAPVPWRRIAKFTVIAMLPEIVALRTGHIHYHQWWTVGHSFVAYLPIWMTLWACFRWLNQSATIQKNWRVTVQS